MSDLFNILSNSNKDIDNQKLMDYLAGRLSGAEKHEVEQWMNENEFANEAMEGLQSVSNPEHVPAYIEQLNTQLKRQLKPTSKRRPRTVEFNVTNAVIAIAIILVLVVLAFVVIHRMK